MTNRLGEWRRLRGLSQADLAKATGMDKVTISRLEIGQRGLNDKNLLPLARALKVQPGELLPLITDGSVPLPTSIASHEKNVLAAAMARFMEIHTDYDAKACERLGMAAVKFYLGALASAEGQPYFDFQQLINNLALDQNTGAEEGS